MLRQYQELTGPVLVPAPAQPTSSGQSDDFLLFQYQELAGPVFVPPAVGFDPAILSWGPAGTHAQRRLPRRRLGDFAPVQFGGLYRAEGLDWVPSATQPVRGHLPHRLGDYARPELAALYGPERLEWGPVQTGTQHRVPVARITHSTADPFPLTAPFDPSGMEWEPSGLSARAVLPRRLGDFTRPDLEAVVPPAAPTASGESELFELYHYQQIAGPVLVPTAAPGFDPSGLQWKPIETGSGSRIPVPRITYSVTDPFPVAAPFDPSGLQWRSLDSYAGRVRAVARITHEVTDPFPVAAAPAFDPAGLQWIPRDRITRRAPRALRGELVQPPRAALYDPSRIEWVSSGRYAGRALQRYRVTYEVEDLSPRPRAPTPVVPVEEVTPGPIQQPFRPTLRLKREGSKKRYGRSRFNRGPRQLAQYRREIRLLTDKTEALAAALTYAEQQQNAEALAAAMRMAQAVEIELTAYLERRRMMQVIAITLLLLEDA